MGTRHRLNVHHHHGRKRHSAAAEAAIAAYDAGRGAYYASLLAGEPGPLKLGDQEPPP